MADYDIDIVDESRRIYNRPCSNRPELDAKGYDKTKEAVAKKAADYFACFASRVEVLDVVSQRPILADATAFRARFQTVFRESGRELQLRVLARLVFAPKKPSGTVMVLDLERHRSLVTPVGPALDGSLGLREPRQQDLWSLYVVRDGRVCEMRMCAWKPADGEAELSGEAAVAALKTKREWDAFLQHAQRKLGDDVEMHGGAVGAVSVGTHELQGRRPTMEDQISVELVAAPHLARPAAAALHFFGVYDGHGGGECARFAAARLHAALAESDALRDGNVEAALYHAFIATDREFRADSDNSSGTCALVAVVGGGSLHIAHAGDSRGVLGVVDPSPNRIGDAAVAVRLTEDHKPNDSKERERLLAAGGSVVFGGRCWRVTHARTQMMLATSRSLGDTQFKESWELAAADAAEEAEEAAEAAAEAALSAAETDGAGAAEAAAAPSAAEAAPAAAEAAAPSAAEAAPSAAEELDAVFDRTSAHAAKRPRLDLSKLADADAGGGGGHDGPELLTAAPTIATRPLGASDRFLILACDGVWDVFSDQQACDSVSLALAQGGTPEAAARKLAGDAFAAGSEDNISVLVALLHPYLC